MIAVTGVSMRFGSKILFEDVTTTFAAGRRRPVAARRSSRRASRARVTRGSPGSARDDSLAQAGSHPRGEAGAASTPTSTRSSTWTATAR